MSLKNIFNIIHKKLFKPLAELFFIKYLQCREWRIRNQFKPIQNRTRTIRKDDILVCSVIHNEKKRLPFFLEYYRNLGVNHFLFVDHESADGTAEYLASQPDCSSWLMRGSYHPSRAGTLWSNYIIHKYCRGHWVLRLDPDEFFVYPYCDSRSLKDLTWYLDSIKQKCFFAPMIDCYGESAESGYNEGDNMMEKFPFFDAYGYTFENGRIKGGFRQRQFYAEVANSTIPINKIPLVKYTGNTRYVASTHRMFPLKINNSAASAKISGCLLHYKITADTPEKIQTELKRKQCYGGGIEYSLLQFDEKATFYRENLSMRYTSWQDIEQCGLLQVGSWR